MTSDPPPADAPQPWGEIDDTLIARFEKAWLDEAPLTIDECLPAEDDPRYAATLEELVHIDREFRWKQYSQQPESGPPPKLESIWKRYPVLADAQAGLIQGEFELELRFAGHASVESYLRRFGQQVHDTSLRELLEPIARQAGARKVVRPGTQLGRYEIVNEQGRGGFGAVWRARDTKLGRRIAVKQLGQRLASDAQSRRRFISEARVTARLEHPGIVPVYDISNVQEDHAYYTMRLIQGQTLAEAIDRLHQLDPQSNEFQLMRRRLLQSFIDACRTIEYAHAQGVIHRDLKPQNMIVGDYGETILLDWGLATVVDAPEPDDEVAGSLSGDPEVLTAAESVETLRGSALGTPAYMPPEQARGNLDQITFRSDVYSLGATLYHLLTGRVPFADQPLNNILQRVQEGALPAAHQLNPRLEPALGHIAARAMAVDPGRRYGSAAELVDDVQRFLADQPVSAYSDPLWSQMARWIRQHPTLAAAGALTSLFLVVGIAAWVSVTNAWQQREAQRLGELEVAAERADATALSQIQSSRFDAAVVSLEQALELLAGEHELAPLATRLDQRRDRTQSILEFYRLSSLAQEQTFMDRTHWAAKYSQAAVNELHLMDHPDWWQALPDDDLSPAQRDGLRAEAYRVLTLLASTRLAETARETITMEMLLNPRSMKADDPAVESLRAARFAAQVANRFRPSRAMRLIEQLADFSLSKGAAVDLTNLNPLNPIDSAVMGSILDNNVPNEGPVRNAMAAVLEMRNPNLVARQWLNAALQESPDWYWLPVFVGSSQVRTGEPLEAMQSLSHAVGVRPDFWVGYQYRALATVAAASQERSRSRRTELLNAAARDIQRARDLQPHHSELYWTRALLQAEQGADPRQIQDTFLTAFALHPELRDIPSAHYSGISQYFFSQAKAFVQQQRDSETFDDETALLDLAIAVWQGDLAEAKTLAETYTSQFPDNLDLKALHQRVEARSENTPRVLATPTGIRFAWQMELESAVAALEAGQPEIAEPRLSSALEMARAGWQVSRTRLLLAQALAAQGKSSEAIELLEQTFAEDRSLDVVPVLQVAQDQGDQQLVATCQRLVDQTARRTKLAEGIDSSIDRPALLNGGFELGLSQHWAPFTRRTSATAWNNRGGSRTSASVDDRVVHQGKACLRLDLDCPLEDSAFGWMSQSIPVTAGQTYRIRASVRGQPTNNAVVQLGLGDSDVGDLTDAVALPHLADDWQTVEVLITPDSDVAVIALKAQGQGQLWLDDLSVERAAEPTN